MASRRPGWGWTAPTWTATGYQTCSSPISPTSSTRSTSTAAAACSRTSRRRRASARGSTPLGFGTKLFDYDNDGDQDIYVTNGHVIDNVQLFQPTQTYKQKDLLYENLGGRFRDVSAESGPVFQAERVGRGLAVADFDNDGNLDVVISSIGQRAVLLRNQGTKGGQLDHDPRAGQQEQRLRPGRDGAGETAERVQVGEINNVASYLSANDIRLHFGLGAAKVIQRIEILWPSGTKQVLTDVPVNQILTVKEP